MRRVNRILLSILASGLWLGQPSSSRANDTMATIGAGGLQFQKTDEIRMEREELYLSPVEVRVSYAFRNLTDHDVRMTVAFPMPDIDVLDMSETPHKFHRSSREGDVFDFHVQVDGLEIAAAIDARAYRHDQSGKEVTAILKKYKMPILAELGKQPEKSDTRGLVAEGLLAADELHPFWLVKTNFHWEQVFPARQTILISHRYKPVIGGFHMGTEISPTDPRDNLAPWCPDKGLASAAKTLPADDNTMLGAATLEYIVKTGANWAGPISRFRLEIDKVGADLVSLCPIPGLKLERRGQSFVAEAAQYVPTADIKLLFVYRACDKAPCGTNATRPGHPR